MTLDHTWSTDPVFPAAVFADAEAGPLLAAMGLDYDDPSNHVPAFLSPATVSAMLRIDGQMLALLSGVLLSFAPHSLSQDGDVLGARTQWALAQLRPIARAWRRDGWSGTATKAAVQPVHTTCRDLILRHGTPGPDGRVVPDLARLTPFFGHTGGVFSAPYALSTLVGGDPAPWPTPMHTDTPKIGLPRTLSATALSYGLPSNLRAHLQQFAPEVLHGATITSDAGSGALSFSKNGTRVAITVSAAPLSGPELTQALARNAQLPEPLPSLAHMAQVKVAVSSHEGGTLGPHEADLLLHTAAAFEGPGTLVHETQVFFPTGWIGAHRTAPTQWPAAALIGTDQETPHGLVELRTQGLASWLGYECACAGTPEHPLPDTDTLMAIAGWLLDAQPTLTAGDTLGAMGRAHYAAHWDSPTRLVFRPVPGFQPQWAAKRAQAGRLDLLNRALHPLTGWRPAWLKTRLQTGRLGALCRAVVAHHQPEAPRQPTFTLATLP